jgi:hypothetical protein
MTAKGDDIEPCMTEYYRKKEKPEMYEKLRVLYRLREEIGKSRVENKGGAQFQAITGISIM